MSEKIDMIPNFLTHHLQIVRESVKLMSEKACRNSGTKLSCSPHHFRVLSFGKFFDSIVVLCTGITAAYSDYTVPGQA